MEKLKIDLCELFKVKEGQHFWLQWGDYEDECDEYCVENNELYFITDGDKLNSDMQVNSLNGYSISYKNPKKIKPEKIKLDEDTKNFLKLIKHYTYISKDFEYGTFRVCFYALDERFRVKYNFESLEELFDIDLQQLKTGTIYSIEDLLKDEK